MSQTIPKKVGGFLLLARDKKPIDPVVVLSLNEPMTGVRAEIIEVVPSPAVGGEHQERLAALHLAERFFGFQDWQRTVQPLEVEGTVGLR